MCLSDACVFVVRNDWEHDTEKICWKPHDDIQESVHPAASTGRSRMVVTHGIACSSLEVDGNIRQPPRRPVASATATTSGVTQNVWSTGGDKRMVHVGQMSSNDAAEALSGCWFIERCSNIWKRRTKIPDTRYRRCIGFWVSVEDRTSESSVGNLILK